MRGEHPHTDDDFDGPRWMIIWPYNAARDGLPNTVRDAGAWVMFDGTPHAYLHICGTPWAGNEYTPTRSLCGRCGTARRQSRRRSLRLARARGDTASYADLRDRYRDMVRTLGFEGRIGWAETIP